MKTITLLVAVAAFACSISSIAQNNEFVVSPYFGLPTGHTDELSNIFSDNGDDSNQNNVFQLSVGYKFN